MKAQLKFLNMFSPIYWWTKENKVNTGFYKSPSNNEYLLVPNLSRCILRTVNTLTSFYKRKT